MEKNVAEQYKLMVIGGSAGSLEVIIKIFDSLPNAVSLTIVLILHRKSSVDNTLVDLLASKTAIQVKEVEDKEPLLINTVYVAPPDYHLLIEDKTSFSLDTSEKVLHSRPSIDVTFESAAEIFGKSVIGILLSGASADGAAGLCTIKECGGLTIVQDPETAEVGFMPQQAIQMGGVDKVINGNDLPSYLQRFFLPSRLT